MRRSSTVPAVLAILALAIAPAQALAALQDIAATHSYIAANYALAKASVAAIPPGQAKIEQLNRQLAGECPLVGAGSPENEASQPMAHEVTVALWSLAYGTNARAIRTFQNTVGRLRWSNHAITRAAETYAKSLSELASLSLPHLCSDVLSWKATGFQTISPAVLSLVGRVEAIELNTVSTRLLAPYERGADASLLARTKPLEKKVAENEFVVGQQDWVQLLETLGLNE
jgi:hypothetical protein